MRVVSAAERAILAAKRHQLHVLLLLEDPDGAMTAVSGPVPLLGVDWFRSARWEENIDRPVVEGTIVLAREHAGMSMAPDIGASPVNRNGLGDYVPFLAIGRRFQLKTAVTAPGVVPALGDYRPLFEGRVDAIDAEGDDGTIALKVRDLGGRLADAEIEAAHVYGTPDGVPIESVMQQIIDDTLSVGTLTLDVPVSPGIAAKEFEQDTTKLLDGVRALALQIGWDLRYRYDATDTSKLTLLEVPRDKTVPDAVIGPGEYTLVPTFGRAISDVRNAVKITFTDADSGDKLFYPDENAASVAKYGRRFMEIGEEATSAINSMAMATAMAQAALSDLGEPKTDQAIQLRHWWPAQLFDLYQFQANGVHYDTDQVLAVVGIAHEIDDDGGRTTITTRGSVAGAYKQWHQRAGSGATSDKVALGDLRWTDSEDGLTRTFTAKAKGVHAVWVYDRLRKPAALDAWPASTEAPDRIVRIGAGETFEYVMTLPREGYQRFLQLEPRDVFQRPGLVYRHIASPPGLTPVVKPRVVLNATRDAADIYAVVESSGREGVRLWVREGEAGDAPEYGLVLDADTALPLYVLHGTELGPRNYFADALGATVQALRARALDREKIGRIYLQAEGEDSGRRSAWVPVPLSAKEQPWLESVSATWDFAAFMGAGGLRMVAKGGAHCASVRVEWADNPDFVGAASIVAALPDGGEFVHVGALTGAERGAVWHVRWTPYNEADAGGLPGTPQYDAVEVPARYGAALEASEDPVAGTGTVTVDISDTGAVLDPALRVKFQVTVLGASFVAAPTTAPGVGATSGTYTYTVPLDPKHVITVQPLVYLLDGSVDRLAPVGLDSDKRANVLNLTQAAQGSTATVTAVFDSDTVVSATGAQYRVDGGAWTDLVVPASRVVQFGVPMSTLAKQLVEVRGKDVNGIAGPAMTVEVGQLGSGGGPSLNVIATQGSSSVSIAYTATGTLQLYINGALQGSVPASPISVSRPAAGGTPSEYTFVCTKDGITATESTPILPIDADTVPPDIAVSQLTPTATQIPYVPSATNQKTGAAIAVTVTALECTMVIGGVTYAAGIGVLVASGTTVYGNRPALGGGSGTLKFRANVGSAYAEATRTVIPQGKDFTPPTLDVSVTPGSSSYSFAYTSDGTVQYRVDAGAWAATPSNPFTISRNPAGGADKTVQIKAVNGAGIETDPRTITVPAQVSSVPDPTTTAVVDRVWVSAVDATTDDVTVQWSYSGSLGTGTFELVRSINAGTQPEYDTATAVVSTTGSTFTDTKTGTNGHGMDLLAAGGAFYMFSYMVRVKGASGAVLRSSPWGSKQMRA